MRCVTLLAALAAVAGAIRVEPNHAAKDVPVQDKLAALGPVLSKLQSLDPKTFGMLSGMLNQAEAGQKGTSFLQYLREDPGEVQARLEKLGPILAKLKGLDPKSFGALSNLMTQVQPQPASGKGVSLLQAAPAAEAAAAGPDPAAQQKLEALAPVLNKLKGLDSKAFGMLSSLMAQAQA
eukprot:CAMPEP_0195057150 /NCGR_PEP_ID=MMETSP0448-20130528/5337_1 /TAXON_ID=66468 /ORGANISM="Heterocapsa triquestra, Strain CCMP 448" /LENGTH=178 /DNA_ID=CAMNT_0040087087 /DNA_START=116 /DNA_END=648 /DNA_ORIENTATION=+